MPWIPEKYEPERPDFEYSRKRAEGGFGMHPNEVLWVLNMLDKAKEIISKSSTQTIFVKGWLNEYGDNKNGE